MHCTKVIQTNLVMFSSTPCRMQDIPNQVLDRSIFVDNHKLDIRSPCPLPVWFDPAIPPMSSLNKALVFDLPVRTSASGRKRTSALAYYSSGVRSYLSMIFTHSLRSARRNFASTRASLSSESSMGSELHRSRAPPSGMSRGMFATKKAKRGCSR